MKSKAGRVNRSDSWKRNRKKEARNSSLAKLILTGGQGAWWISEPWLEFTCLTEPSSSHHHAHLTTLWILDALWRSILANFTQTVTPCKWWTVYEEEAHFSRWLTASYGQLPLRACKAHNRQEREKRTDARQSGKITFVFSFILACCLQNEYAHHEEL